MRIKNLTTYALIFTLSIIVACIAGVQHKAAITPIILVVSTAISIIAHMGANSTGKKIVTWYYIVVVPVQVAIAMFSPQSIIASHYNKNYDEWLFWDEGVMEKYLLYSFVFIVLAFFTISISERITIGKRKNSGSITGSSFIDNSTVKIKFPFMLLLATSYFDYYIRQGPINGYLSFFSYGLLLFCLANVVIKASYSISFTREILQDFLGILIYSAPGLLAGRREYLMYAVFMVSIFLLLTKGNQVVSLIKTHIAIFSIAISVFVIAFGLISYIKFGVFDPIRYIVSRVVGLFDGCTVLKYLEGNKVNLGFENYVMSAFNDSAVRANKYYTNSIIGFPVTARTNSAAPIFIISLLYGNTGMVLLTMFFTFLLGIFSRRIRSNMILYKNGYENSAVIKYKLFILSDIMVIFLHRYFLDGNVEILKEFSPPLVAYVLFYAVYRTTFIFRRQTARVN